MGAVPASWVAYRQGRKAEESAHDAEVDTRLRVAEVNLAIVRDRLEREGKLDPASGHQQP